MSQLNLLMDCRELLDEYLKLVDIGDIVNMTDGQSVTSRGFKIRKDEDYNLLIESLLKLWVKYSNVLMRYGYVYTENFGKKLTSPLYYAVLFLDKDETATGKKIKERSINISLEYAKMLNPLLNAIQMREPLSSEQESKITTLHTLTNKAGTVLSDSGKKQQYDDREINEKTGEVFSDVTEQTEQTEQFKKLELFRKIAIYDDSKKTIVMEDMGIANLIYAALKQSIKLSDRTIYKTSPYPETIHTFMTSFLKVYYRDRTPKIKLPLDKIITYDSEQGVIHIRTGVTMSWGALGGDRGRYCDEIKIIRKAMYDCGIYYTTSDSVKKLCFPEEAATEHKDVALEMENLLPPPTPPPTSPITTDGGRSSRRRKAYKTTRRNNKHKNKKHYRRKRHTKRCKKSHRRRRSRR
jgi:hypothetical protein